MPSSTRPPAAVAAPAAPAVNHEAAKRGEPPLAACRLRCSGTTAAIGPVTGTVQFAGVQRPFPQCNRPAPTLPCWCPFAAAEAVAAQLAGEFPEFDAALIGELLAQEDGDDG